MTSQQAQQQIDGIDKQIDDNRRALLNRIHANPGMSAHCWQNAWDRCPDLYAIEHELYLLRDAAQRAHNQAVNKEWDSQQRRERAARRKVMKAKLIADRDALLCQCGLPILPSMKSCELHA